MSIKLNTLIELFKNEKFKTIFIFFFEKPRSTTEVEKLSSASRTTIYNQEKMCELF